LKKLILSLCLLLASELAWPQLAMVLTSPKNVDEWIVNMGDKMGYVLKSDSFRIYTGIVEDISESGFTMFGQQVRFSDLLMIKVNKKHARKSMFFGLLFLGAGAAVDPLNKSMDDPLSPGARLVTQIAFLGTGAFFFIKGIAEASQVHQCYLDEGWKVRSVKVTSFE